MEQRMSNKKPKPSKRIDKFMGGRMTPREAHAQLSVRRPCVNCQLPATIRIRVLAELEELKRRQPQFVAGIMATNPNGPYVPTIATTYGAMVMLHDVGSCDSCRKAVEVQVAHGQEDWMLVEIDRGPANIRPMVQSPGLN